MGMIIKYVYSKSKRTLVRKAKGNLLTTKITLGTMEAQIECKLNTKERVWETYAPDLIGVVVAIGPDKIGWSKVNESEPKKVTVMTYGVDAAGQHVLVPVMTKVYDNKIDLIREVPLEYTPDIAPDRFNKRRGVKLAIERAQSGNIGLIPKKLKTDYDWVVAQAQRKVWAKDAQNA